MFKDTITFRELQKELQIIEDRICAKLANLKIKLEDNLLEWKKRNDCLKRELHETRARSGRKRALLLEEIRCSICLEYMTDPHLLPTCYHRFCRQCIHDAMRENGRSCPLCRRSITIEPKRDEFARSIANIILGSGSNNEANHQPNNSR